MKFAVVVLACIAVASAQFQYDPYNPFSYTTQRPQYKYKPLVSTSSPLKYQPYKPYSTPAPLAPVVPVVSTVAPVYAPVAVAKVSSDARNAEILKLDSQINPDGSYAYAYETQNGIAAQEQGVPRDLGGNPPVRPVVAQGSYAYTSPEGRQIVITYVADENGYQPQGDSLPTPPPIPAQILRSLEYIAKYAPPQK